ncbi:MAG: methyltransferase domain-containing protein [Oscillospiraceae bacterium]|nr:methyltransferase domain-containing protein [Oscillospiraceae bacterium]
MEVIKQRITRYWSQRAEAFQTQRIREFGDEKHARWLRELGRYIPGGRPLRVLDLGTGTGFFAFVLAAKGHEATGIDLTPDMIERARETAEILGLDADFFVMDAEQPEFEPESFDLLVTRNLSWTLPHLGKAYREWYKLLKPGGVLVNFDADYCRALEEGQDEGELPANHAHKLVDPALQKENDDISMELFAYQMPRPQWDVQLLIEAGFERVSVDMGVYRRVYREIDEFYNPTPIFAIAAYK